MSRVRRTSPEETVSSAEIKEMLAELRPGMDFPGLDSPDYDEPPTEDKEDTTEEVNNDGPEESGAGSEADPGGDRGES